MNLDLDKLPRIRFEKLGGKVPMPKIAIMMSFGRGALLNELENAGSFERVDKEYWNFIVGDLNGCPVLCLEPTYCYKDAYSADVTEVLINRIGFLKRHGCETLIIVEEAYSLRSVLDRPNVMIVSDHINMSGSSPLIKKARDEKIRNKVVDMSNAYDIYLSNELLRCRHKDVHTGLYLGLSGSSLPTLAERKEFIFRGVDAVGFSLISPVIIARHYGLRVAALCGIMLDDDNTFTDAAYTEDKKDLQLIIANLISDFVTRL